MNVVPELQLKSFVIEKLSQTNNRRIRMALMDLLDKSENTIWQWLAKNHKLLSKPYSLDLIGAYLEIEPSELTEPRPVNGADNNIESETEK